MIKIISKKQKDTSYCIDLEKETLENTDYRRVLFTSKECQLVLMNLKPGESIGMEKHDLDQFLRFEKGSGIVTVNGIDHEVKNGFAILIPKGSSHNVTNVSDKDNLKLYSIYSPPNHKKGTIHKTKENETEEHFDGQTDVD